MSFRASLKYNSSTYSHLTSVIGNDSAQQKYIDDWRQKYAPVFKNGGEGAVIEWDIRISRALKGVFTSASFYIESHKAKENESWAAFYFLSYYSLFHAKLACIYLIQTETVESLVKITHSKIRNLFYSTYCNINNNVVKRSIRDLFDVLKFSREYYSYQMPFNDFLEEHPVKSLPSYLRACYQLANLHSELVELSFDKHGHVLRNPIHHQEYIIDTFQKVNTSRHPLTGQYLVEPSDNYRMSELLRASAPTCFTINLEHYCDEFRTYCGGEDELTDTIRSCQTKKIWEFIYSAIH